MTIKSKFIRFGARNLRRQPTLNIIAGVGARKGFRNDRFYWQNYHNFTIYYDRGVYKKERKNNCFKIFRQPIYSLAAQFSVCFSLFFLAFVIKTMNERTSLKVNFLQYYVVWCNPYSPLTCEKKTRALVPFSI